MCSKTSINVLKSKKIKKCKIKVSYTDSYDM